VTGDYHIPFWRFPLHVTSGCGPLVLEIPFLLVFYQHALGLTSLQLNISFFALPLKYGGLGIVNPVVIADCYFNSSLLHCLFTELYFGFGSFELDAHITSVNLVKHRIENLSLNMVPEFLVS